MRIGSNENTARRQAGRVFARSIRTNDTPVCFPTQKRGDITVIQRSAQRYVWMFGAMSRLISLTVLIKMFRLQNLLPNISPPFLKDV